MDRMLRVAALWRWLPEFRAVAETEHLTAAARRLGISPSALSRTVRLLEGEVGQPLFQRSGRRMELNDAGRALLGGARSAMRLVDESLARIGGTQLVGPVRIATTEPATSALLLPALARLHRQHPELTPSLRPADSTQVLAQLLQGDLDVAFVDEPVDGEQLTTVHLANLPRSVAVGAGHPRFGSQPRWPTLEAAPFAVRLRRGQADDGWPPGVRRHAALTVETQAAALAACRTGEYLTVLPDIVIEAAGPGQLTALRAPRLAPLPLYAIHRVGLGPAGRAEVLVAAVLAVAAARSTGASPR